MFSIDFKKISATICICFTVIFSSFAQQWNPLTDASAISSVASNYSSITSATYLTPDDNEIIIPYVSYTESNIVKVKRLMDGAWVAVGGNVSDGNAAYAQIFRSPNETLYVTYVDQSTAGANKLAIKTFNKTTSVWEALGANATNLYVSTGSILQTNGTQLNSSINHQMAFDANNVPHVIYADFGANAGAASVKKYNGTAWEIVGGATLSADRATGLGLTIDQANGAIYAAFLGGSGTTNSLKVFAFKNNAWASIAITANTVTSGATTYQSINEAVSGAYSAARHSSLTLDRDKNLIIGFFNAANSNRATYLKYNQTTNVWSLLGVVSTRDASYIKLITANNGDVYTSFIDAISNGSGRSVSRVFQLIDNDTRWSELTNVSVNNGIDEPSSNLSFEIADNGRQYIVYTKANSSSVVVPVVRLFSNLPPPPPAPDEIVTTPRQIERLDRGVVAVRTSANMVYVGWRMFGTDPTNIGFNVYRGGMKLNSTPITNSTNYQDNTSTNSTYTIKPVLNGVEQQESAPANIWAQNYLSIPLTPPPSALTPTGEAYNYVANDCSVGDLDGDGQYEIILKWDPSNAKDNSHSGYTGNVYLDAYKLNGTRLWRIDLGRNIRAGAHYTQFMVYDLDGDGKAEVACKTADGTIDGVGTVIGNANADFRNTNGYVLTGPEFLTVFNGLTGAAMATKNYIPARGAVSSWGDNYGNRVDRFTAAVAYVDGAKPSLIMGRGYYTRQVRVAWDWRNGELTQKWVFDTNSAGNAPYFGQGNHQLSVADPDGDGKDEIFNGSSTINDKGNGLWSNGRGHGDALHVSDMDTTLPGLEVWMCYEDPSSYAGLGLALRNAKTGELIWGVPATGDVGRALAADIDPQYPGYEMWGTAGTGIYTNKGVQVGTVRPSVNFAIWWDGDLSRELLDGTRLDKWNTTTKNTERLLTINNFGNAASNNGTKATPGLTADILGDWREELIYRSSDSRNLLLFTTTIPTTEKLYTLMHDTQYRTAVAWQNTAYNQPPHPSFFLGTGMQPAPVPNIVYASQLTTSIKPKNLVKESLGIYPNPVKDKINFNLTSKNNNLELELINLEGKKIVISTGTVEYLETFLNSWLKNIKKGVYILNIYDKNKIYTNKMLKID
ncbi:T9SS type A sorting domain-containing protein [Pedobacter alpinus]|uniref:T9SS type A sorting domain-containing protein n=1 Tax=Pedobacter alpinus TaxID=1590643 RepID=A0ABW5TS97_9SPHI